MLKSPFFGSHGSEANSRRTGSAYPPFKLPLRSTTVLPSSGSGAATARPTQAHALNFPDWPGRLAGEKGAGSWMAMSRNVSLGTCV